MLNFTLRTGEHNHPRDDHQVVAAELMSGISKRVRETVDPIPSIFNEMLAETRTTEWDEDAQEVIAKIPTFYSAKGSLYR